MAGINRPGKVSIFVYVVAGLFAISLIVLIIGLAVGANCRNKSDASAKRSTTAKIESLSQFCKSSPEAERIKLNAFLKKVQKAYFENSPDQVVYDPDVKFDDMHEHLKQRYDRL